MAQRKLRDDIVLATKYSAGYKGLKGEAMRSNYGGNSAKSLHVSVEDSLKKLQTSYIDLVSPSKLYTNDSLATECLVFFHSSTSTTGTCIPPSPK